MKFMLMMHTPRGNGEYAVMDWTPEALKAHVGFMKTLNRDLRASGNLLGAEGLAPPGKARVVVAGDAGAPLVTDGPYPESKEFLAGFWLVEVESAEQAYAIAARASSAPGPRGTPMGIRIEVREVMSAAPVEV